MVSFHLPHSYSYHQNRIILRVCLFSWSFICIFFNYRYERKRSNWIFKENNLLISWLTTEILWQLASSATPIISAYFSSGPFITLSSWVWPRPRDWIEWSKIDGKVFSKLSYKKKVTSVLSDLVCSFAHSLRGDWAACHVFICAIKRPSW